MEDGEDYELLPIKSRLFSYAGIMLFAIMLFDFIVVGIPILAVTVFVGIFIPSINKFFITLLTESLYGKNLKG